MPYTLMSYLAAHNLRLRPGNAQIGECPICHYLYRVDGSAATMVDFLQLHTELSDVRCRIPGIPVDPGHYANIHGGS